MLLLVGPATNFTTVLVVARMLGRLSAVMYVGTIAVMSLVCGAVLDLVVGALDVKVATGEVGDELLPPWLLKAGAIVLAAFLAASLGRWVYRKMPGSKASARCCSSGACEANARAAAAADSRGEGGCRDASDHPHKAEPAKTVAGPSCDCGCGDEQHRD